MKHFFCWFFVLIIIVYLTGCGGGKPVEPRFEYTNLCIDGVLYYKRYYRMATAWNRDGTLKLCEVE